MMHKGDGPDMMINVDN